MRKSQKPQQPKQKKTYSRPKLTTHGDVAKLTKKPSSLPVGPPSGIDL